MEKRTEPPAEYWLAFAIVAGVSLFILFVDLVGNV